MEHRIQFLRDSKGQPVGCVAIKIKTSVGRYGGTTLVTYQMSVLNPLDKFDRRMARQLALGRLTEAPLTTTIDYPSPSRTEISRAVMEDIKHDPSAPTRARKAAKQWLKEYDRAAIAKAGTFPAYSPFGPYVKRDTWG